MRFKSEDIEIVKGMLEEAAELLKGLEEKIVNLERVQSKDLVNDIFRVFHSLKGLAGFANVKVIVDVTHAIESALKKVRDENVPIGAELIDLLLDGTDLCRFVLNKIAEAVSNYSGGELEVDIEGLGEEEIIRSANSIFDRKVEVTTPQQQKQFLPSGFETEAFSDFIDELEENLHIAEDNLLEFEKNGDPNLFNTIMRSMHSIKGGARLLMSIVGDTKDVSTIKYIERISHLLEDVFQGAIRKGTQIDLHFVFHGVDLIKNLASCVKAGMKLDQQKIEQIESFLSGVGFTSQEELAKEEETEDFATREAFLNIASQLIEYAQFIIQDPKVDKSELSRIAEPLKAGLMMIGQPEKISLVDQIVRAGELGELEELKRLCSEFLSWLSEERGIQRSTVQECSKSSTVEKTVSQTVRVNKAKLDNLVNLVGELITAKNTLKYLLAEVISTSPKLRSELKALSMRFERLSYDFQASVMALRMTPVEELFRRYNRTVRDLAKALNKNVVLKTEGEDVEIDRSVIEQLSDPMTHLVRNAIDHGIEPVEERRKLGKPDYGTVTLRAYYKGNSVCVEVEDDGRGIDVNKIKLKALDKGLITEEQAMNMNDDEALQLIFLPGFSTAEKVSDLSGRGVGMDVVKTNVESIGGKVSVKTQLGKGTVITMSIPLSLMAVKGLLIKVGDERYIVPTDTIRETLKVPRKNIYSYRGLLFTKIRGEIVPVMFLEKEISGKLMDLSHKQFDFDMVPLLLVKDGEKTFAFVVDSFIEEGDYLVKNVPDAVRTSSFVTGATVMGDGSIVLIINPVVLAG